MRHVVILVSTDLLPFSFKFVYNSSFYSSHDGGAWYVVVVGDGGGSGGSADKNFGAVLSPMSFWCLLDEFVECVHKYMGGRSQNLQSLSSY